MPLITADGVPLHQTRRALIQFRPMDSVEVFREVSPYLAPMRAKFSPHADGTKPIFFAATGRAVLDAVPDEIVRSLAERHLATVRPEAVVSRPATRVASLTVNEILTDDDQTAWALKALGGPRDTDGRGVLVAIIDTGVDVSHPCLRGRVSAGTSDGGIPATGHGTHCAGLVAGARVAGQPQFGIAPAARIRSYRVFGSDESASEGSVRSAIHLAVRDGCKVLVLAAGFASAGVIAADASLGTWLARNERLLFSAAGNESDRLARLVMPVLAPANAPGIRAIGAITGGGRLWNGSNGIGRDESSRVDAVAPGTSILSAWPTGQYRHMSGTSVATAVAGGVAAALWSRYPSLSSTDLYRLMARLADRRIAGDVDGIGDGLLSTRIPTFKSTNGTHP